MQKQERFQAFLSGNRQILQHQFKRMFVVDPNSPDLHQFSIALLLEFIDTAFNIRQDMQDQSVWNQLIQRVTDFYHDNYQEPTSLDLLADLAQDELLSIKGINWQPFTISQDKQQEHQEPEIEPGYITNHVHTEQKKEQIPQESDHQLSAVPTQQSRDLSGILNNRAVDLRLKNIFEHFCMQVQHVGATPTFQRIAMQCKSMSYGKLSRLATHFGLLNARLTAKVLNSTFNFVTHSMKTLNFMQFKQLLEELCYIQSKDTIIDRLGIRDEKAYRARMRELNIPICANKLAPVDPIQHKRMFERIQHQQHQERVKLMPSLSSKISNKKSTRIMEKGSTHKLKHVQQRKASFSINKFLVYEADDTFYLREYKDKGEEVVDRIKRRASEQKTIQSRPLHHYLKG